MIMPQKMNLDEVQMNNTTLKERIESVLEIGLTDEQFMRLTQEWKAFCAEPGALTDSIVPDMVRFYLKWTDEESVTS